MSDMNFSWHSPPLSLPSDFGDGYRLPKYVVSFTTEDKNHIIHYGEGTLIHNKHTTAIFGSRFCIYFCTILLIT